MKTEEEEKKRRDAGAQNVLIGPATSKLGGAPPPFRPPDRHDHDRFRERI